MEGFIKIYRKIREHWIWENSDYLKWWIDLLMMANHKPKKTLINGIPHTINAGEHHTSEIKLSERWYASRPTVDKFLKMLQNDGMIEIKKSRQNGTTIKISNYHMYQAVFDDDGCNEIYNGVDNETATKLHKQEPKNKRVAKATLADESVGGSKSESKGNRIVITTRITLI